MRTRGKKQGAERREVDVGTLHAIVEQARSALSEEQHGLLKDAVDTLATVTMELEQKGVSIRRLRSLLFGASTEKTSKVLAGLVGQADGDKAGGGEQDTQREDRKRGASGKGKRRKGHGRNGADKLRAAERIAISHAWLRHGDRCPDCKRGNLYAQSQAKKLVRIRAMAPISAAVYECERLRCGACGEITTAAPPTDIGSAKYDESVASMIALLKYGCGLPFYRIAKLQKNLGIPLPATTQWDLVHQASDALGPVWEELCRQAAAGEVIHNDDTTMKILAFARGDQFDPVSDGDRAQRRGVYTTGIISKAAERQIALFFTGLRHAGENLGDLLARREKDIPPPIQMCDALSHNTAGEFTTIVANCIAHARRKFVDVAVNFPEQCRHVLKELKHVYEVEAQTQTLEMSADQRLAHHRAESGPRMATLAQWLQAQLDDKLVEPNSGAGEAIKYMIKHWQELTLFLREPGAPLDNNLCERALKKAILHRKNALFYKTQNGARVGDLYMSLVYTAELAEVDPFDYLHQMLRHPAGLQVAPADWLPWNYQATVATLAGQATVTDPPPPDGIAAQADDDGPG